MRGREIDIDASVEIGYPIEIPPLDIWQIWTLKDRQWVLSVQSQSTREAALRSLSFAQSGRERHQRIVHISDESAILSANAVPKEKEERNES